MKNKAQQTSDWIRFDASDVPTRRHLRHTPPSSSAWAVMWDGDDKIYFSSSPQSWGGSGWYADPADVISKPTEVSDGK